MAESGKVASDAASPQQVRALGDVLADEALRVRSEIAKVVEASMKRTEDAVVQAMTQIRAINERARQQSSELAVMVGRVEEERRTIAEEVQRQVGLGAAAAQKLRTQAARASHSLEMTDQIVAIAQTIDQISTTARLLTINGHIEAARHGDAGRPFAVIVDELRTLSKRVEDASQRIGRLASDLTGALPQIVAASMDILHTVEQITSDGGAGQGGWVREELGRFQRSSQEIFHSTAQLMQEMQFQDLVSQDLAEALPPADQLRGTIRALCDRLAEECGVDVVAALEECRAPSVGMRLGRQSGASAVDVVEPGAQLWL